MSSSLTFQYLEEKKNRKIWKIEKLGETNVEKLEKKLSDNNDPLHEPRTPCVWREGGVPCESFKEDSRALMGDRSSTRRRSKNEADSFVLALVELNSLWLLLLLLLLLLRTVVPVLVGSLTGEAGLACLAFPESKSRIDEQISG